MGPPHTSRPRQSSIRSKFVSSTPNHTLILFHYFFFLLHIHLFLSFSSPLLKPTHSPRQFLFPVFLFLPFLLSQCHMTKSSVPSTPITPSLFLISVPSRPLSPLFFCAMSTPLSVSPIPPLQTYPTIAPKIVSSRSPYPLFKNLLTFFEEGI